MPKKASSKFEGQEAPIRDPFAVAQQTTTQKRTRRRQRKSAGRTGTAGRASGMGRPAGTAGGAPAMKASPTSAKYVAPPGMEHVVKRLKRKEDVANPYAVAWSMHGKEKDKHQQQDSQILKIDPGRDLFQRNLRSLDYISNGHHSCKQDVIDRLYEDALIDLRRLYQNEEVEGVNFFEVWKHVLDETKKDAEQAVIQRNRGDIRRCRLCTQHRLDDPDHLERFLDPVSPSGLVGSPRNPATAAMAGRGHGPTVPAGSATTGSMGAGGASVTGGVGPDVHGGATGTTMATPSPNPPAAGGAVVGKGQTDAMGRVVGEIKNRSDAGDIKGVGALAGPFAGGLELARRWGTPMYDENYSSQGATKPGLDELDEGKDQSEYDQEDVQEEVAGEGKGIEKEPESQPEKEQKHFLQALAGVDLLIEDMRR